MKLSKRSWLVIAAGVFIIALASLGLLRSQQVQEQNELNEQLASVRLRLSGVQLEQLSSRQAELEEQLSQATPQFEVVKAILSQPVGSFAVSSTLFDTAEAHGVEVTEMTSPSLATESLEGVACLVISFTARVEGDVPNLVSFVTNLNEQLATGVVKSTTITIPEMNSEEKASAVIELVVYSYRGD